ncbi:MAG: hypothetical protein KBG15_04075, partial [Kofleriaceae bacterium]|nr:hypothetical protein [Kofleriaceae bacterium]
GQKASGQKASGQKASGQKASGQKASGQKASGQKASGQKAGGQKASGQKIAPDKSRFAVARVTRGNVIFGDVWSKARMFPMVKLGVRRWLAVVRGPSTKPSVLRLACGVRYVPGMGATPGNVPR